MIHTRLLRENDECRKKIAHEIEKKEKKEEEEEKEIIDMNDMKNEIKRIVEARRRDEKQVRDNEFRIKKNARVRSRSLDCACEERSRSGMMGRVLAGIVDVQNV